MRSSKDSEKIQKYGIEIGEANCPTRDWTDERFAEPKPEKTITFCYYLTGKDAMRRLESEIENFKRREEAAAQARAEILRLVQGQRTALATDFNDLLGDGGPDDETADEMIRAIREWRDTPSDRSLD